MKYKEFLLKAYTKIVLTEANTFLENNKMINIIFNYIFRLTFQSPFSKYFFIYIKLDKKHMNHYLQWMISTSFKRAIQF